jgi:hypothetical protein
VTRHERIYGRLLRLYPRAFRAEYGAEMARLFGDQLRDAQSSGEPRALVSLWLRSIVDLIVTAPRHHLAKEHLVPQPVDAPSTSLGAERRIPDQRPRMLLGLLPLWIILALVIAVPGFMDPIFSKPPEAFGLPLGVVSLGCALSVMGVGVVVLWRTTSRAAAILAFACLTVPAAMLSVLAPAIVLILMNLSSSVTGQ